MFSWLICCSNDALLLELSSFGGKAESGCVCSLGVYRLNLCVCVNWLSCVTAHPVIIFLKEKRTKHWQKLAQWLAKMKCCEHTKWVKQSASLWVSHWQSPNKLALSYFGALERTSKVASFSLILELRREAGIFHLCWIRRRLQPLCLALGTLPLNTGDCQCFEHQRRALLWITFA